jgi:hypothetical protein
MMRSLWVLCFGITMGVLSSGCSPSVSDSSICRSMGFFVSQAECTGSTQGACQMTQLTSQSTSKTVICWKPGTSTASQSPTPFVTSSPSSSPSGSSCLGQTVPWSLGAWSPAQCGPGVPKLQRSVNCYASCPCNSPNPAPSTETICTPNLYGAVHYDTQCVAAGGVVSMQNAVTRICVFSASSCPSGWNAYKPGNVAFTATSIASAEDHINCLGGRQTVFTGFHALGEFDIESKDYCNWRNCFKCKRWVKVYANVTKVGCY